jgi:hypothetical protein
MTSDRTGGDKPLSKPGLPPNFEQIDPHRANQHRPAAGNSADRADENLKGARRNAIRSPTLK